jgi:AraC-like DNA-binding protein
MEQFLGKARTEGMALGLWFQPMADALDSYNVDSAALMAEVGIDLESMADPWKRFPVSVRNQVWDLAIEATGDPCFGFRVAEYLRPPTLGHLGYALYASSTLLAMFKRLERFMLIVSTDASHQVEEFDGDYRVLTKILEPTLRLEAIDCWMLMLVRLCQIMYSPDFRPLKLELQRPPPKGCDQSIEAWFSCPVSFSSDQIALYVSKKDMLVKLPGAVKDLALQHDRVLASYLVKHQSTDILTRIRVLVTELLPTGDFGKVEIAKRCHMSPRTLQNKLDQVGTSYNGVLDSVRQELALEYIKQPHRNLIEITFLLGFTDSSSFSRAFKRWTGVAPSHYQNQYLSTTD